MIASKIKITKNKMIYSSRIDRFLKDVEVPVTPELLCESLKRVKAGPLTLLHSYLPLGIRFLQESYLALENNEVVGILSIIIDCRSRQRWKINHMFLKPNSYDVGKLLIEFIVNKYGAEGVETFLVEVDSANVDALDLFKNGCGFRQCTVKHIYCINIEGKLPEKPLIDGFRPANPSDSAKLYDLYVECLTPQAKLSLDKSEAEYSFSIFTSLKEKFRGIKTNSWVMVNSENNSALAYAGLLTRDPKVFYASIMTSLPYSEYYEDILNYLIRHVYIINPQATIYLDVSGSIQSHSRFIELLKSLEVPEIQTNYLLVKDYWRPLKERKPLASPVIIFPESTSPACNSLNIVKKTLPLLTL